MDDRCVEDFFESVENLDPLGAFLPRDIRRVRRRWSAADACHLPRLLVRLQTALDYPTKAPPDFESVAGKANSDLAAWLCLEAICAIQRRPEHVPSSVRDCLYKPDYSLRAKALGFVRRAKRVDALSVNAVRGIARDAKASIGNRLYAIWVLWRLKLAGCR